jgi:hypothetical protein
VDVERIQLSEGGASVQLTNDVVAEPIEFFDVFLVAAKSPWVMSPRRAPVYVLDDDGTTPRASFRPLPDASQSESKTLVQIPVFLAGLVSDPVTVSWSVAPGTASADDYALPPSTTVTFTASDRMEVVEFTLVDDSVGEGNETLQVNLEAGPDYALDSPSTLTLTIVDNEESIAPETKFHHPRDGWRYSRGDYRIREMHAFARDRPVADDVAKVEMALRKKKTDGSCRWWNDQTRRWDPGNCTDKHWVTMSFLGPYSPTWPLLYEEDFPRLSPSIGTTVRNYTAWSRATDGAGNVETTFTKGRNFNTFEVRGS